MPILSGSRYFRRGGGTLGTLYGIIFGLLVLDHLVVGHSVFVHLLYGHLESFVALHFTCFDVKTSELFKVNI